MPNTIVGYDDDDVLCIVYHNMLTCWGFMVGNQQYSMQYVVSDGGHLQIIKLLLRKFIKKTT